MKFSKLNHARWYTKTEIKHYWKNQLIFKTVYNTTK